MPQAGVYIWKYEQGNYFIDCNASTNENFVDKIFIEHVSFDGSGIFDISTEEVGGLLQYKAGEFDLSIMADEPELSSTGESIYNFFQGGSRNYKFVIAILFGNVTTVTSPYTYFLGKFTNTEIAYRYISRKFGIKCKPLIDELEEAMSLYKVGTLSEDMTYDIFLMDVLLPQDIQNTGTVTVAKSFANYATLIGDPNVIVNKEIQRNSTGDNGWVDNLDVWNQFIELMQGTGLLFKLVINLSSFSYNTPVFALYIFSLDSLPAGDEILLLDDPEDVQIFKAKSNLYIEYRNFEKSGHSPVKTVQDGVGYISETDSYYVADEVDRNNTNYTTKFPAFWEMDNTADRFYVNSGMVIGFGSEFTNIVELPLYDHDLDGVFGDTAQIAYARILTSGNTAYAQSQSVYNYAIRQYSRYLLGKKKCKRIKCVWDSEHIYDVLQSVTLYEYDTARTVTYYISRIENIDNVSSQPSADLTLIEI